jgi:hypothetical protein
MNIDVESVFGNRSLLSHAVAEACMEYSGLAEGGSLPCNEIKMYFDVQENVCVLLPCNIG